MINQSKAEDYFRKIPSIQGISGVRFFEGKASLTKLLHFSLYIKDINMIKSLMDFDELFAYLRSRDLRIFMFKRIEKNIKFRIIRKRNYKRLLVPEYDKEELREKRYLPDDFDLGSCFFIFGNYVSIFTIVGKPHGVLIENEYYRKTLDSIFENLWEVSEKPLK